MQSALWARAKSRLGNRVDAFEVELSCAGWFLEFPLLIVHQEIGGGSEIGYVPWGPPVALPQDDWG